MCGADDEPTSKMEKVCVCERESCRLKNDDHIPKRDGGYIRSTIKMPGW